MNVKKLYYMECRLAGRQYHDINEVWDELHLGTELELRREPDNRYDCNAVAVIYHSTKNDEDNEYIIGYIPRSDNGCIAPFFDMGYGDIFECRISKINPYVHYEDQIGLTIRIIKKKEVV